MTGTAEWGGIEDAAGLLAVRIAAWNHMEYPENVPAAGDHNAEAIRAGGGAIEVIDEIIAELHRVRQQLHGEIRADQDARAARVDAMLAESRARREDGAR